MHSIAINHPSQEVISRFAQGRLSLAEAARWEQHFAGCEPCGEKLAQVGSDNFIDLLKQPSVIQEAASTVEMLTQFPELPAELRHHNRYSIQKRLGRGGMGMVYHATHRLMNRPVALKMIRGDLLATPVAVTRFRREVQAAAHLDHANIVTAFDAEEVSGVHFLVMEYVEGKSLDQLIIQKGPLAVPLVCSIARQIAQGLHHAHSLGMIHRDIKPNNVMITRQGKIKILDFGLARWSGRSDEKTLPQITMAGSHLGTLMYAAPEQRKSAGEVDVRADLYSLGATMVYLLTGKPPPFVKDDHPTEELLLPLEVPVELQAVINRMLMPLPEDRYPNAKTVVDALSALSSNNNISSAIPPQATALRYSLQGALVVVVVLIGLLIENYLRNLVPLSAVQSDQSVVALPASRDQTVLSSERKPSSGTPEAQAESWKSLLPLIHPQRDAVAGTWNVVNDGLSIGPTRGGRIVIPGRVPLEYDLRISFTRKAGKHSVGAVLVHGGRQCTFELDAWEQHLAGFQNVDGQSIIDNTTRTNDCELENNHRYTLLIEVRAGSMRASLNDKEISQYRGNGKNLSVDDRYWAVPNNVALGLLSWESWTIFHSVELRPR